MADDPTCGAVLDRAEIGYIDHDGDHVCTLGPEHPHIRNHVCHCGYVWPRVNSPTTTRATAPTATQLYNAVKELRAAANGHRVLTIPEINSVLVARAEYAAGGGGRAAGDPGAGALGRRPRRADARRQRHADHVGAGRRLPR